jgi:hypothetical protein
MLLKEIIISELNNNLKDVNKINMLLISDLLLESKILEININYYMERASSIYFCFCKKYYTIELVKAIRNYLEFTSQYKEIIKKTDIITEKTKKNIKILEKNRDYYLWVLEDLNN